jgi:hypothetical protein
MGALGIVKVSGGHKIPSTPRVFDPILRLRCPTWGDKIASKRPQRPTQYVCSVPPDVNLTMPPRSISVTTHRHHGGTEMLRHKSLLVSLVLLVDRLPWEPEPTQRSRGRPKTYSDRLILKALVIMIIRRLSTADALPTFLNQDEPLPRHLRSLLSEQRRFPSRRTWERRLATLPPNVPGLIGYVGRHLVSLLQLWAKHGRAVACDSTPLATGGGVWHKTHREQGVIPHTSIDTAAGWSKSGWHGWW